MGDTAVVVVSCDRYEHVWEPFFTLYRRYWPDCPWPTYLVTDEKDYHGFGVVTVRSGPDRGWSSRAKAAIREIGAKELLVLLEDFLLCSPVDTAWLLSLLSSMRELGAGYLRLVPTPGPDEDVAGYPGIGRILPGSPYRASLQPAYWTADTLDRVLVHGETAWDVEFVGSVRSNTLPEPFLCVCRPVSMRHGPLPLRYCHGIQSGKWWPAAQRLCREEGIAVDRSWHSTYTFVDRWRSRMDHAVRYGALGRQVPVRALVRMARWWIRRTGAPGR